MPLIFIISLSLVLNNSLIEKPVESFIGTSLTALGIPVFIVWKKRAKLNEKDILKYTREGKTDALQ